MADEIVKKVCENCVFGTPSGLNTHVWCRFNPPASHPVLIPKPPPEDAAVKFWVSEFPLVRNDLWCGHHIKGVILGAGGERTGAGRAWPSQREN